MFGVAELKKRDLLCAAILRRLIFPLQADGKLHGLLNVGCVIWLLFCPALFDLHMGA